MPAFSAVLCRGLIEAPMDSERESWIETRFPRFCAAASLKPAYLVLSVPDRATFSAVLCRGLIEAGERAWCAARVSMVFRGFVPRPH